MSELFVTFHVDGIPRPKQSFKYTTKTGKMTGYTPQRVKDWQEKVGWAAKEAMMGKTPVKFPVCVELLFALPRDGIRRDLDNLSKGTLDALKHIVYADDNQVTRLTIEKRTMPERSMCGVHIVVRNTPE